MKILPGLKQDVINHAQQVLTKELYMSRPSVRAENPSEARKELGMLLRSTTMITAIALNDAIVLTLTSAGKETEAHAPMRFM